MPTEYIAASVPAMRDALRRRLEYTKQRLGPSIPKLHVVAWVSFLWGAQNGMLIGINDLQELRELLPPLGYDPTDAFGKYPRSPENQALIDAAAEDDPVWYTVAERYGGAIGNALHFFAGQMPDADAVAFYGYLRGRLEAGSISRSEYDRLVAMLPVVENNPVDLIAESAAPTTDERHA